MRSRPGAAPTWVGVILQKLEKVCPSMSTPPPSPPPLLFVQWPSTRTMRSFWLGFWSRVSLSCALLLPSQRREVPLRDSHPN